MPGHLLTCPAVPGTRVRWGFSCGTGSHGEEGRNQVEGNGLCLHLAVRAARG